MAIFYTDPTGVVLEFIRSQRTANGFVRLVTSTVNLTSSELPWTRTGKNTLTGQSSRVTTFLPLADMRLAGEKVSIAKYGNLTQLGLNFCELAVQGEEGRRQVAAA